MEATYVPAFTLGSLKPVSAPARPPAPPTTPNFINDIAAGKVELPTIPRVLQALMTALRRDDVDARSLGEMLSQDPVLASKVLRLANSSFFGGQRSMASIEAAVALIGLTALQRLVIASGVSATFAEVPGIDLKTFWRDALVAATAAAGLASRLGADADEAYTVGLLHGTGHLILCRTYPEIAEAMFTGFDTVRGEELAQIERDAFGIDHPTVTALWVDTLGFPLGVGETIRRAARPPAADDGALDLALQGARALVQAVARGDGAEAAWAALPAPLQARVAADAAFGTLYEALRAVEPSV
jgi:HD-like signal output (HDOD) protein